MWLRTAEKLQGFQRCHIQQTKNRLSGAGRGCVFTDIDSEAAIILAVKPESTKIFYRGVREWNLPESTYILGETRTKNNIILIFVAKAAVYKLGSTDFENGSMLDFREKVYLDGLKLQLIFNILTQYLFFIQ